MKTIEEYKNIKEDSEEFKALGQEDNTNWLSVKIFNKLAKDIKYVLVTNYIHQQLLQEELARTGLYQWQNVFNGEVKYPREVSDYNDYDIVQVNMSAQDINLVNTIREQIRPDSNTKLILNNDYTTEAWGMSFEYPETVRREICNADMLFGTEYFQTTALAEISGRQCYVIPHPADIKRLKSIAPIPKKNIISTIWRRYDRFSYIPSLAARNHGLVTQLLGYDKNQDPKVYLTTTLYDCVYEGTNFFEFLDQLRESRIVYDPFTFHSYSRTTVDTAALGIPVVVSNRTQSGNICYPYTCVDPYDVKTARDLIKRLLTDKDFNDLVVKTALERCEFYNHENSRERYLSCLYDSIKLGRNVKREYIKPEQTDIPEKKDDVLISIAEDKKRKRN